MRPLHPPLPEEWISRVVRLAMPESDWDRFERLAARAILAAPTQARAYGAVISRLLEDAETRAESGLRDWQDWERRKALKLLPALRRAQ